MRLIPIVSTFVVLVPALAAAQAIDVKTGLWETTVKSQTSGMESMVDTSKMTPEQRARIQGMMQNMAARERKSRSCVTAEDLARKSGSPIGGDDDCEYSYTSRSASKIAGTVSCHKRGMTQTGDFSYQAQGREAVSGTMHMHVNMAKGSAPAGAADVAVEMNSRWLGSDCGDVKPRSLAKKAP